MTARPHVLSLLHAFAAAGMLALAACTVSTTPVASDDTAPSDVPPAPVAVADAMPPPVDTGMRDDGPLVVGLVPDTAPFNPYAPLPADADDAMALAAPPTDADIATTSEQPAPRSDT
ncbi:MAG: hypothetical protein M3485_05955, partial [Pseudomonadota bacterium]|nr:hypothetical protein [Pseudomonadota bacterium]